MNNTDKNPSVSLITSSTELPILKIKPAEGTKALLDHKFTDLELKIVDEMDLATASLPEKKDPEQDIQQAYKAVIPIGQKYGLHEKESIAFWVRTTFFLFEKE